MTNFEKIFDPKACNVEQGWNRAYLTKCLISVCRLAIENETPNTPEQDRLARVGETLRLVEYLADLVDQDAFEMKIRLERLNCVP